MSDMVFGNPWHGRLTPGGLVLSDASVKTSMAGTNAAGTAVSISYKYPGADTPATTGNTYYVKTPGLPAPETPAELSAIGGEYANDAILFGYGKRYSPFSTKSLLGVNEWIHYGADGKWRKLRLEVVTIGPNYHAVRITRRGLFGQIGQPEYTEATTIAEITLTHTAPTAYVAATFPALDASSDGRSIVVTRVDAVSAVGGVGMINAQDHWEDGWSQTIIAAWRIDIDAAAGSAAATKVWEIAPPDSTVTPIPTDTYTATGSISVTSVPSGGYFVWTFLEPFSGRDYNSYGELFSTSRLVGVAWAPDGELQLIEWRYRHDFDPIYYQVSGNYVLAVILAETQPAPPASAFPASDVVPSKIRDRVSVKIEREEYQIEVYANNTLLYTMSESDPWPVWSERMTNNVYNLRNSAASVGRFGPGAADVSPMALSPLYASYNPRANAVVSSTTPIGFV